MILTLDIIKEKQETLNELINFYSYLQKKYGQKKENQELEEIKKKQEELNEMIKTFEREQEKKEENLSTVYVPKNGEKYFSTCCETGIVLCNHWESGEYDKGILEINNVFKTEKEAKNHIEWLKILYELRTLGGDYFQNIKKKSDTVYAITYDCEKNGKITPMATYWFIDLPLPVWFSTKEQVEHVIETIGEDRLKKYWFRVEG